MKRPPLMPTLSPNVFKMIVSASVAGVFSILKLFPENWEMVGGRNVPLGGSAQGTIDPGVFLSDLSNFDDGDRVQFNLAFGQVITKREDGLYDFNVEKANNKDQFHFDLSLLARVFREKLAGLNLARCTKVTGETVSGLRVGCPG